MISAADVHVRGINAKCLFVLEDVILFVDLAASLSSLLFFLPSFLVIWSWPLNCSNQLHHPCQIIIPLPLSHSSSSFHQGWYVNLRKTSSFLVIRHFWIFFINSCKLTLRNRINLAQRREATLGRMWKESPRGNRKKNSLRVSLVRLSQLN